MFNFITGGNRLVQAYHYNEKWKEISFVTRPKTTHERLTITSCEGMISFKNDATEYLLSLSLPFGLPNESTRISHPSPSRHTQSTRTTHNYPPPPPSLPPSQEIVRRRILHRDPPSLIRSSIKYLKTLSPKGFAKRKGHSLFVRHSDKTHLNQFISFLIFSLLT